MIKKFENNKIKILDIFYCPHAPTDSCECRKPNPGMILKATKKYNIDLEKSWIIGDQISDINAGINAGINNTILINSEYIIKTDKQIPKYIIKNLNETKNIIVAR